MPRQVFEYDPPQRFVVGTVGQPGSRTFFLQARSGARVTSVALEKEQVAALAERIEELLDDVLSRTAASATDPAGTPSVLDDREPLDTPILEEFRVGTLALAWDSEAEALVIEARAVSENPPDDPAAGDEPDTDVLRVRLPGPMARGFAQRALVVVAAGRPPCPFCSLPLDAEGHICPRMNGYRR